MPPKWLLGWTAASQLLFASRTPLVSSGPNPSELVMNLLIHGRRATQGYLLLRHMVYYTTMPLWQWFADKAGVVRGQQQGL